MLSEEDMKAIEILENEKSNLYVLTQTKCITCTVEQAKAKREAIDTVLNLIDRLQKENEHWKNGFEKELEDNRKNTCELLKQDLIIREKDKQIDLMGEYINNIQDCPLENCGINLDCENKCNNHDELIKQCWIKYFEKLAKEKGE